MNFAISSFIKHLAGQFVEKLQMTTSLCDGKLEITIQDIHLKPQLFERVENELRKNGQDIFSHGVEINHCSIETAYIRIPILKMWSSRWEVSVHGVDIRCSCLSTTRVGELRRRSREQAAVAAYNELGKRVSFKTARRRLSSLASIGTFPPLEDHGEQSNGSLQKRIDAYFRKNLDLTFQDIRGKLFLKDDVDLPGGMYLDEAVWKCSINVFTVNIGASMIEWPIWAQSKIDAVPREVRCPKDAVQWMEDVSICIKGVEFTALRDCFCIIAPERMFSLHVTKRSWSPGDMDVKSSGFQRIFVTIPDNLTVKVEYDAVGFQWGIIEPLHEIFEGVSCALPDFADFFVANVDQHPEKLNTLRYLACLRKEHAALQESSCGLFQKAGESVDARTLFCAAMEVMEDPLDMLSEFSCAQVAEMYHWVAQTGNSDDDFKFVSSVKIPYSWYISPFYRFEVVMWITSTLTVEVETVAITLWPELRTVMVRENPGDWLIECIASNIDINLSSRADLNLKNASVRLMWHFHPEPFMSVAVDVQSVMQNIFPESRTRGTTYGLTSRAMRNVTEPVPEGRALRDIIDDILATRPWQWKQWAVFFGEWGIGPRPIPFTISANVTALTIRIFNPLFGDKLKVSVKCIQCRTLRNMNLRTLDGAFSVCLNIIQAFDGYFQIAYVNKLKIEADLCNLSQASAAPLNISIALIKVRVKFMSRTLKLGMMLSGMMPSLPKNLELILLPDLPQSVLRVMDTLLAGELSLHLLVLSNDAQILDQSSGCIDYLARKLLIDFPAVEFVFLTADNVSPLRASFPIVAINLTQSANLHPSNSDPLFRKVIIDFRKFFVDIKTGSMYEPILEPVDIALRLAVNATDRQVELACDVSELSIILCSSHVRYLLLIASTMNVRGPRSGPDNVIPLRVLALSDATTTMQTNITRFSETEDDAAIAIQRVYRKRRREVKRELKRSTSRFSDFVMKTQGFQAHNHVVELRSGAESKDSVTLGCYATVSLPTESAQWINFNRAKLHFDMKESIKQADGSMELNISTLALQPDMVQLALRQKAISDIKRNQKWIQRLLVRDFKMVPKRRSVKKKRHNSEKDLRELPTVPFSNTKRLVSRVILSSHCENEEIGGVVDSDCSADVAPVAYFCQRTRNLSNEQLIVIRSPILIINGTERLIRLNVDLPQAPLHLLPDCRPINPLYCGNQESQKSDTSAAKGSILPFHAGSVVTADRSAIGDVDLRVCSEFVSSQISIVESGTVRLSRNEVLLSEVFMTDLNIRGKPQRIINIGLRAPLTLLNQTPIPLRAKYRDILAINGKFTDVIAPGGILNLYCLMPDRFLVSVQYASKHHSDSWSKYILIKRDKEDWREIRCKARLSKTHAKVELAFRYKNSICAIGTPSVIQTRKMDYKILLTKTNGVPCFSVNSDTHLVHSNKKYLAQVLVSNVGANQAIYPRVTSWVRAGTRKLRDAFHAPELNGQPPLDDDVYFEKEDANGEMRKRGNHVVKFPNLFFSTVGYCTVTLYADAGAAKGRAWTSYPMQCKAENMPQCFGPYASISGTIITIQPRYFIVNRTKLRMHFRLVDHSGATRSLHSTYLGPQKIKPIWLTNETKYPIVEVSTQGGFWSNQIPLVGLKTGRYSMAFGELILTVDLFEADGGMYLVLHSKVHYTFRFDASANMVERAGLLTDSREHRVFWVNPPENELHSGREVAIGFVDPFSATSEQLNTVEIIFPTLRGVFCMAKPRMTDLLNTLPTRRCAFNTPGNRGSTGSIESEEFDGISESVRFSIRLDGGSIVILIGPSLLARDPSKVLCLIVRLMRSSTQVCLLTKHVASIGEFEFAIDHCYICFNCGGVLPLLCSSCSMCRVPLAWPVTAKMDACSMVRPEDTKQISLEEKLREWKDACVGASLSLEVSVKGVEISLFDRQVSREISHILIGPLVLSLSAPYGLSGTKTLGISVDWLRGSARFSKPRTRLAGAQSCKRDIIYTRSTQPEAESKLLSISSRILQVSTTCITVDTLNVHLGHQIEVTVDDDILGSFFTFIRHILDDVRLTQVSQFDRKAQPSYWANVSNYQNDHVLATNIILKVKVFIISKVHILIWAKVNFKKLPWVPHYVGQLLRVFTLWDEGITLKRGIVHIEPKTMKNVHKSLVDFANSVVARYSWDIGRGVLRLIGSSNLFNLFSFIYLPIYQLADWVKSRREPETRLRQHIYVDSSHSLIGKDVPEVEDDCTRISSACSSVSELYLRKHHVRYLFAAETLTDTRLLPKRNVPRRFVLVQEAYENILPELFCGLIGFFEVDDENDTFVIATTDVLAIFTTLDGVVLCQSRKWDAYSSISSPRKNVIHITHANSAEPSVLKLGPIKHFDSPNARITIRHIATILLKQAHLHTPTSRASRSTRMFTHTSTAFTTSSAQTRIPPTPSEGWLSVATSAFADKATGSASLGEQVSTGLENHVTIAAPGNTSDVSGNPNLNPKSGRDTDGSRMDSNDHIQAVTFSCPPQVQL